MWQQGRVRCLRWDQCRVVAASRLACTHLSPSSSLSSPSRASSSMRKPRGYWQDAEARRTFLDEFAGLRGITDPAGWQKVRAAEVRSAGGSGLLARFSGSLHLALQDAYPDAVFAASAKPERKDAQWADQAVRKAFLDSFAAQHGVDTPEAWAKVKKTAVRKAGGCGLLKRYGSLKESLAATYTSVDFAAIDFAPQPRPRGFWSVPENRTAFLRQAAEKLEVKQVGDWRSVSVEQLSALGGGTLVKLYRGDVALMLKENLAEMKEVARDEVRRKRRQGFWQEASNQRQFLDRVAEELGIEWTREWQREGEKISLTKEVLARGGSGLLAQYHGSLSAALRVAYPDADWSDSRPMARAARGEWASVERRREFFDTLAMRKGIREPAESPAAWKAVSVADVTEAGGSGVLAYYDSMHEALNDVYGTEWRVFECRATVPGSFWEEEENVCHFLAYLKQLHRIEKPEDWCRLSVPLVQEASGGGLLQRMSLVDAVLLADPKAQRESLQAGSGHKRAIQRLLRTQVEALVA